MKAIDKRLSDLKARQEAGEHMPCPRCGRDTMKPGVYTNALSRATDIHVCDSCGVDEAKLAFMNAPNSLYSWALLQPIKPKSDFKAQPAANVIKQVCSEQSSKLVELFEKAESGESPDEIRYSAFESLPGLSELWTEPFQANYGAADGTVIVRIRRRDSQTEMAVDIVNGK